MEKEIQAVLKGVRLADRAIEDAIFDWEGIHGVIQQIGSDADNIDEIRAWERYFKDCDLTQEHQEARKLRRTMVEAIRAIEDLVDKYNERWPRLYHNKKHEQ